MNSSIVSDKVVSAQKYPVLKKTKQPIGPGLEYVVLFTSPRKGFVVHVISNPSNEPHLVVGWDGSYGCDPSGGFGEAESFIPFDGTIQLSN